jgi:DNA-binding NarL/FixJ family response regulator
MGDCFTPIFGVVFKIISIVGMKYRVLVVDDFVSVCDGLAAMIEKSEHVSKVFSAYNAAKALELVKQEKIHAAIVDARMPEVNGIALIRILQQEFPSIKLIGMTSFDDDDTVIAVLRTGVPGFLFKRSANTKEVNHCLKEVLAGNTYYTPEVQKRLSNNGFDLLKSPVHFSDREWEVLKLICQGYATKHIADNLHLSISTVEEYRKSLLKKTNTKNTAELVDYAHRNGLV